MRLPFARCRSVAALFGGALAVLALAAAPAEAFVSEATGRSASLAAFAPDPNLNSAALAPPFPFSGSANFQRLDDYTSRWEGPLTASFPGRPDTPLTGRGFAWRLSSERQRGGVTVDLGSSQYSFGGGFLGGRSLRDRDPWSSWR